MLGPCRRAVGSLKVEIPTCPITLLRTHAEDLCLPCPVQDNDTLVKLADFGLAHALGGADGMSTICGTPSYMSPEIVSRQPYSEVRRTGTTTGGGVRLPLDISRGGYVCLGTIVSCSCCLLMPLLLLWCDDEQKTDCWSIGVVGPCCSLHCA